MSPRQILRSFAALVGSFMWLGTATMAIADPIAVYLTTTINWASDSPFFYSSTVRGVSSIFSDARGQIYPNQFFDVSPSHGPTNLSTYDGPLWINPGETILWSLGGLLSVGGLAFPVCAYGAGVMPTDPCNPSNAPRIPIATLMSDHFGSFFVTGAVFAFDSTVQIGTWEIHSHQGQIPEPATLTLLGLGLAGLGFARRKQ
jgi:hypothetical protein